jgi:hypothetical protein
MPFKWAYSIDGSDPIIQTFTVKDAVVLSAGELVTLDAGEVDAAASGDSTLVGIAVGAVDNTDDGLTARCIMNPGAVYYVEDDANARKVGDRLDIAAGGLTVAADSNHDLIVVRDSAASEPTYVAFNGTHFLQI